MSQKLVVLSGVDDLMALLDKARAKDAREVVRQDPGHAIALVEKGRAQAQLTLRGQALILEEIVGEIADPAQARKLLKDGLPAEALAEIVAVRCELPSVLTEMVDADTVVAALVMAADTANEESAFTVVTISLVLRLWAEKLKDRKDWQEILEKKIGGKTLRDCLIAAVCHDAGTKSPSADLFDEVGLEPDAAIERLRELRQSGKLPRLTHQLVDRARARLRRKKQDFEAGGDMLQATRTAVDEIKL